MSGQKIRVKVLSKVRKAEWYRHFPGPEQAWGNCQFLFSSDERKYDWLVVYDDLPRRNNERFSRNEEVLACTKNNTLLITTEPSTIKTYGKEFTNQFAHVLTPQEEWALPHPGRIYSQPALHWLYGVGTERLRNWQEMHDLNPIKSRKISTVFSAKQHMTNVHILRKRFIEKLKPELPELDIFGYGIRVINDKAEALDDYYYHLAIENYIGIHHWTEKLSDSFLGMTLPFYAGCPNAADYFPEESFVAIDLCKPDDAIETIKKVIHDNEYKTRLPAIIEAKRRVLEEYNFFAVISDIIGKYHQPGNASNIKLRSRRAILVHSLLSTINYLIFKTSVRTRHWVKNHLVRN